MLRSARSLVLPATVVFAIALAPRPARADDEAAGRVLFSDAMAEVKRGQFAEACPKFEESLRQSYNINAHYFLADCLEKQGKTATAWTTFLRVATKARDANDEARELASRKRAEALEPRLVRLRIAVTKDVDGLEVRRNGSPVGRPMWNEVVPVDPGDVEFTASAPGFEPFKSVVSLTGEGKTVEVKIPELVRQTPALPVGVPPAAVPPAVAPQSVPPSPVTREGTPRRNGGSWRTVGWVAGGAGLATMAAGGVVALLAKSSFDVAKSAYDGCQSATCRDQNLQKEKTAISNADIATGLFIGGGAAAAVGLVLVLAGGGGGDEPNGASVSLSVLPGGLSLGGRF